MRKTNLLASQKRSFFFPLLLVLAAALSACGYSNPYVQSEETGELKPGTHSIYVEMWGNKTSELGFQSEVKQSLVRWLKKSPHLSMASRPEQADYILSGAIESLHLPGLSYGKWDRAVELRAEITFSVELKKRDTGEIILRKGDAEWQESYDVGRDAATLEMNKREALREIADNIAENVYVNLFNRFSPKKGGMAVLPLGKTNIDD